MSEQSLRKN